MTLLTEHIEAGWREVESGLFGRWVAEKFHSLPGASSSVLRVEAESSRKLQAAVSLRESQLTGTSEPIKDTITNDGSLVTGPQHESLRTEGVTVAGTEQVVEPVPNEDEAAQASLEDASEAQVDAPQVPADAADLTRLDAPADAESSAPESQSTPSDEDEALARFHASLEKLPEVTSDANPEAEAAIASFENEGGASGPLTEGTQVLDDASGDTPGAADDSAA